MEFQIAKFQLYKREQIAAVTAPMKAHGNCAGHALKAVSHPDLQTVNSALEMWFKARASLETSEVLFSQGWVFAQGLALLCISLPQTDFARLTSLLEILFLLVLVNDRLKPNLPEPDYK